MSQDTASGICTAARTRRPARCALGLGVTAGVGAAAAAAAAPRVTPDPSTSPFTSKTSFCTKDTAKHTGPEGHARPV